MEGFCYFSKERDRKDVARMLSVQACEEITAILSVNDKKHTRKYTQAKKQMIRYLFVKQLMRKYKLKTEISKKMGFEYRRRNLEAGRKKYRGTAFRMSANVRTFLEQDSNSRITAGKRDTIWGEAPKENTAAQP